MQHFLRRDESPSCQSYCLVFFITRKWNMRSVNEESLIDVTSKATTNERPNPVNPMIGPVSSDQGRPKRPCWVHRSSRVSPTCEDVGPNHKPNQRWPKPSKCSLLGIHHGRIHSEQQRKRQHNLPNYSLTISHTTGQRMNWSCLQNK